MSETEFLILLPCWEEVYWNCCPDLRKSNFCIFLSLCSSYVWYESWQKLLRKKSMFPERKKLFPPLLTTRVNMNKEQSEDRFGILNNKLKMIETSTDSKISLIGDDIILWH